MSRILKRPMFRIGGSTNEGIMNMAVPKRAGYQDPTGAATPLDNYKLDPNDSLYKEAMRNAAIMNQFAGSGRSERDRALDLLLRGSIKLASERPVGNIFSTAAKAFQEPVDQYLKSGEAEETFQRQLRLAGLTSAMTAQENREKYKKESEIANQKLEQSEKEMFIKYSGLGSKGLGVFETFKQLRSQGERILSEPITIKNEKPDIKEVFKIPKGTVFVDANARIYRKTDDSVGYEPIQTTGGIPVKPAIEKEQGFFEKYGRQGLKNRRQELMEQLDKLRLQKTARGE